MRISAAKFRMKNLRLGSLSWFPQHRVGLCPKHQSPLMKHTNMLSIYITESQAIIKCVLVKITISSYVTLLHAPIQRSNRTQIQSPGSQ